MTDHERIATLLRQGLSADAIAAILNTDLATVRDVQEGDGSLPSGGGGSNIVHGTDVDDQTITILTPGQPQDVETLWRITGPGLFAVACWAEVHPAGDNDYVGLSLIHEDDDAGSGAISMGPNARAFSTGAQILAGGWLRNYTSAALFSDTLGPSQWRDYKLTITGYAYNEADPGDTTTPLSGNVQIRNVRVVAVRLDA